MATGGALTKSDLEIAIEKFERYPLAFRTRYDQIISAPNRAELLNELAEQEQQAFLIYLELVDKIDQMVRNRIQQAHAKPVTFAAQNYGNRQVIEIIEAEETKRDQPSNKRWSV